MSEEFIATNNDYCAEFSEDTNRNGFIKKLLIIGSIMLFSILTTCLINNPYGSYIPIIIIAIYEWYISYPRQKRSYYGLCRLLLYILFISLWVGFILKIIIQNTILLLFHRYVVIGEVQHLLPYTLVFTMFARNKHEMSLYDKRRYIIHFLYDVPAFILVIIFKLLNHPLNSLYSQITSCCYLGCLPTATDVKTLNDIGIKYVVNMCAEYNGPRRTYEKYHIKQLHLPTVDSTAPSLESIEKAIKFTTEAYKNNEKIFIHCKSGMARSASIVLCHLVANENMTPVNALKLIKEKRPEVTTRIIQFAPVRQFLASLKNK